MKHEPLPARDPAAPTTADDALAGYTPVTLQRQRHDGWTAERQRTFLTALAETGCISEACRQTGITARSAYRLRAHAQGERFARAWDQALRCATAKLLTLAYERAVRGSVHEHWRDGKLIAETRAPSDKLLTFLLGHLAPWNQEGGTRWARLDAMANKAAADLAPLLDAIEDSDVPADPLGEIDYCGVPPAATRDESAAPFDEDDGLYD